MVLVSLTVQRYKGHDTLTLLLNLMLSNHTAPSGKASPSILGSRETADSFWISSDPLFSCPIHFPFLQAAPPSIHLLFKNQE